MAGKRLAERIVTEGDLTYKGPVKPEILKQWETAKARHPGMILLFRIGEFYETLGEDASTLAKICGCSLTPIGDGISGAGFHGKFLEQYLQKLLRESCRVAICEDVT